MRTVRVNASSSYDVQIGQGLLRTAGSMISQTLKAKRFAVISDDSVAPLYAETVIESLKSAGLSAELFAFEHGEASKCSAVLNDIYSFLAANHFTRADGIIALGGGVTGDMAGFAAATYLRGMELVQIPTSLLSQVDSSVGGKTAIDIPEGKNLVGAFKQPSLVIIDTETLKTLPRYFLIDGMGEVIKYGMIKSASLFEKLCGYDIDSLPEVIDDVVFDCISIKRDVVEADEYDHGERELLNFGHTLGHSIEQYYNYTGISHGRAVAKGMELITELAAQRGLCGSDLPEKLSACLEKYELKIEIEPALSQLGAATLNDKKRSGSSIDIVICGDVGVSHRERMSVDEFLSWLE